MALKTSFVASEDDNPSSFIAWMTSFIFSWSDALASESRSEWHEESAGLCPESSKQSMLTDWSSLTCCSTSHEDVVGVLRKVISVCSDDYVVCVSQVERLLRCRVVFVGNRFE